jgi:hypothetical protein
MWTPFPHHSTYPRSCQLTTTMAPERLVILNHSERAAADSLLSLGRDGSGPSAALTSPKRAREDNGLGHYMMPRKRYAVGPFANAQYYPAPIPKSSYESAIGFPPISPDNLMVKPRRFALHPAHNFPLRRTDFFHHASFAAPTNNNYTSSTPRLVPRENNRAVSVSPASIDLNSSPKIPEDDITEASTETDCTGIPEDDEPPKIFDREAVISLNLPSLRSKKLGALRKNDDTKENHGTNIPLVGDIVPSPSDVLIGTGRTCSSHPGNRRFHKAIYESFQEYFSADYKKGVVDRAIASVHEAGGRFLAKGKHTTWVMVKDMDRLERNTRKSFHMAKKQRQRENPKVPDDVMPYHRHTATSTRKLTSPKFHTGLHVAVYRKTVGDYCIGKIEAQENGNCLLRFNDSRFGVEWVDLNKTDCRVFSD